MFTTVHCGKCTLSWQVHHLASVHIWQVLPVAMCWMRIGHCTLNIGHWTLDIAHRTLDVLDLVPSLCRSAFVWAGGLLMSDDVM